MARTGERAGAGVRAVGLMVGMLTAIGMGVSGCNSSIKADRDSQSAEASAALIAPQSLYVGELPCADCSGIRYELDLRARNIFFVRSTYLGKAAATPHYVFGQWSLVGNHLLLKMLSGGGEQEIFAVQDATTLKKLDSAGKPVQSALNYSLVKQANYTPIEPTLRLNGMYSNHGDAATFTECLTGIPLPVAEEGQYADLRTAYTVARKDTGQSVFVEMDGRIAWRASKDGSQVNTLVVDKVGRFFPLRTCEGNVVTQHTEKQSVIHELTTTRWVPTAIGAATVTLASQQREPFIVLQTVDHRVGGFAGCNRLMGSYEQVADKLKFAQVAVTRMACADGMEIEQALLKSLAATVAWRITGDQLDLLDGQGAVLANFVARNL